MNAIYFKVNNKGNFKQYFESESYREFDNANTDLIARATAKGFKRVKRVQSNYGVTITYSNGIDSVDLVYLYSELSLAWLKYIDLQRNPANKCFNFTLGRDGNVYYNNVKVA